MSNDANQNTQQQSSKARLAEVYKSEVIPIL